MPVILITWEAEIRKIKVETNPGKQFSRPHVQKPE
jgi:hypothetical protein